MPSKGFLVMRWILATFTHRMSCEWEVPFDGEPCVFVGNHAGAFGPIDMVAKFPLRDDVRPWFNDSVQHVKEVPAYVRQDYWWKPGCKLEPLFNATLPYIAAVILPPIMHTVEGVPVFHDSRVMSTMKKSIRYLREGKHLVIFPEQPSGWKSHHSWINTGFLKLAPLYHRYTGKELKFWPVNIDYKNHLFHVGAPITFDSSRMLEEQQEEMVELLAAGLRGEKRKQQH